MKYVKQLPFDSILDGDITDAALWSRDDDDPESLCEFQSSQEKDGKCDTSGLFYGTGDSREPKFCARHFYQHVVNGDGKTNYKLTDDIDLDFLIESVQKGVDSIFTRVVEQYGLKTGDMSPEAESKLQDTKDELVSIVETWFKNNR